MYTSLPLYITYTSRISLPHTYTLSIHHTTSTGTEEVKEVLRCFRGDAEGVVKENCEVALDVIEYWDNFGSRNSDPLAAIE